MDTRPFFFKKFGLFHHRSTMKIGTDAIMLSRWVEVNDDDTVLDIGTGCGLIPLMLAQKGLRHADAVEIDGDSFEEASQNFRNSVWNEKLTAFHCDIRSFADSNVGRYDLVVSNPPFFVGDNRPVNHKKDLARHAGNLSFSELLSVAKKVLKPSGRFALVLPEVESRMFLKEAENQGFYLQKIMKIVPIEGKQPNRVNMQLVLYDVETLCETFIIRHADHSYTKDFKLFLKDYYLD